MNADPAAEPVPIPELSPDLALGDALNESRGAPGAWLEVADTPAIVLEDDLTRALALGLANQPLCSIARTDLPGLPGWAPDESGTRRGATALGWEVADRRGASRALVRRAVELEPVSIFAPGALASALPPDVLAVLDDLGRFAGERGRDVLAVGGLVRDLVLDLPSHEPDIDLVVDGDAIALATAWARARGNPCTAHAAFGTATVEIAKALTVDLTSMRRERYASPGALPQVEPGTLLDDLHRRDFTVNALAMRITHPGAGTVIDPLDGWGDLRRRVLRVHHPLSFVDDPTRLIRAARYRTRFGLEPDAGFERARALALATGAIERVSGARVFADLARSFREREPGASLRVLAAEEILAAIDPRLGVPERAIARVSQVRAAQDAWAARLREVDQPIPCLAALVWDLDASELEGVRKRLDPPGRVGAHLEHEVPRMRGLAERLERQPPLAVSEIHRLLSGIPESMLVVASVAAGPAARSSVRSFADAWRHVGIATTGSHLRELGFAPGPVYGAIQQRLLRARLDGEVHDLASELELVRREFPPPDTR